MSFKLYPYQQQAVDALLESGGVVKLDTRRRPGRALGPDAMARRDYGEASYFDGYHFQHIADWYDAQRLARIDRVLWSARR